MNLSLGIVGLPNVGKSTLFNALTASSVPAENYPFCTIEPNVGVVAVNDQRLEKLAELENSAAIISAVVKFVDIAGLVKGASRGEGLGNKFLSHIREVDAIVQVIRSFVDDEVTHVDKTIDPARDKETIEAELIIKDTEAVEKRLQALESQARGDEKFQPMVDFLTRLLEHLNKGELAYSFSGLDDKEIKALRKELFLLTDKPMLYIVNEVNEKITPEFEKQMREKLNLKEGQDLVVLDIKLEQDISTLDKEAQEEFLADLGLDERPLDTLIQASYKLLGLISFFTAGEKEARAWTIYNGDSIVEAAGTIHNDFAEKFIAADVVSYDDFVSAGGWEKSKEMGKIRLEGREYIVKDGDVVIIRHGA